MNSLWAYMSWKHKGAVDFDKTYILVNLSLYMALV